MADKLHASFDKIQLSIFQNVQKIHRVCRRYTDDIKEFALTLYFYSPKAYQYVRSILPLPNPSLIRKWASSVDCEPGFLKEALKALSDEVKQCPDKKDCYLIMDAMSIRKETVWDKKNDRYDGFINYGTVNPEDPHFSCIRAQGGWNNNANTLQLKYSLRKMPLRNAVSASKNAICTEFTDLTTITSTVIPFFHNRKHKTPLSYRCHQAYTNVRKCCLGLL